MVLADSAPGPTATAACPSSSTNLNGIGSTPSQRHTISASLATQLIAFATKMAADIDAAENVAVVDPAGFLVGVLRMDNAFPGSVDLASKKARSVVLFNGFDTQALYAASLPNGSLFGLLETNGGLVFFPGGSPLYLDGFLLGAIGVSGGTPEQDGQIASAAAAWFADANDVAELC
ncbi:hypothetical protein BDV97DRAFT_296643 [Delphinella strobiligena]|nr:hypothetical protein BDV97DRAFT_296643 [Delphinella strobiligena]